jgi:hypothetical protein
MAIFNSYVAVYQRVAVIINTMDPIFRGFAHRFVVIRHQVNMSLPVVVPRVGIAVPKELELLMSG